jgi:uncharacterized protein (DUF4415 family)
MTIKQMQEARKRGLSQSDWVAVQEDIANGIEPQEDDDSPDASFLMREAIEKRRAGRPVGSGKKEQVAIRLDKDILLTFRSYGSGWQTRMNDALRQWLNEHS